MKKSDKNSAGYACWLNYGAYGTCAGNLGFRAYCRYILMSGFSPVMLSAAREWQRAAWEIFGIKADLAVTDPKGPRLELCLNREKGDVPGKSRFRVALVKDGEYPCLRVSGSDESGVLYGVFHLIRAIGLGRSPEEAQTRESSRNELRMVDHWDNLDGSIERGYAGRSLFFSRGRVHRSLTRISDYARLLASVGINAVALNNVNVFSREAELITEKYLPEIKRIALEFQRFGIRTFLSVSFSAPMELGGLPTADPLDPSVRQWWNITVNGIYREIPGFGGFLVKADSESRPGPYSYGRDHAQGANMLADALEPHGGLVIWRCFVYNCHLDWRDRTQDRAKMAYENFKPLDGKFRDNVILQVKNGPVDFQIREPVSPLFGALGSTNVMMECQITQEYTGQQKDLCYLVPIWKEALDFDTCAKGGHAPVSSVVDTTLFGTAHGGMAGVSNVGDGPFWTGHPLAQANLYGFGRLSWDPGLTAGGIAEEWTALTFGSRSPAVERIAGMLLRSRKIYEDYTCPLGIGWFVNPGVHYGPSVDGYEYSRWGTYHRADFRGVGVDRTKGTGTGYAGQYCPPVAERYENRDTCPEELLLFFHYVPYAYRLKTGETLIQHIYNTHFEGCEEAERLKADWMSLRGEVDEEIFEEVLRRMELQTENAREWRDVVNTYFYRKTGIADEKGRTIYP